MSNCDGGGGRGGGGGTARLWNLHRYWLVKIIVQSTRITVDIQVYVGVFQSHFARKYTYLPT